jgi:hypothetical protein
MSEDTSTKTKSDRYELDDLFVGEGHETQHFLKMVGVVLLVVLLLVALGFPFLYF